MLFAYYRHYSSVFGRFLETHWLMSGAYRLLGNEFVALSSHLSFIRSLLSCRLLQTPCSLPAEAVSANAGGLWCMTSGGRTHCYRRPKHREWEEEIVKKSKARKGSKEEKGRTLSLWTQKHDILLVAWFCTKFLLSETETLCTFVWSSVCDVINRLHGFEPAMLQYANKPKYGLFKPSKSNNKTITTTYHWCTIIAAVVVVSR